MPSAGKKKRKKSARKKSDLDTALIQKVSDKVELNKPGPQMVVNNQ